MCKAIENSTPEQKALYLAGMRKTVPHKQELIMPWLTGLSVVDVGCADAFFTQSLLQECKKVVGIDISPEIVKMAQAEWPKCQDDIEFRVANVENFTEPVDNVVCSSVLHEVYSYGEGLKSVGRAIANIHKNLNSRGRIIIRDFIKPVFAGPVEFRHYKLDITEGHRYLNFHSARHTDPVNWWKFSCTNTMETWEKTFGQKMEDVYEYIFHKDFHNNWETEVKETYGFWTLEEAKSILTAHGFKIIHATEMENQWIVDNRLKGKVKILSDSVELPFPKYQCLIVAEKA